MSETIEAAGPYITDRVAALPSRLQLSDLFFVSGVLSSFFTGYLRDHFGGVISFGLTDGLLAVAFFLAILTHGPRQFLARTPMTAPLLLLLLLSMPFALNPEAQIIEGLLGFRAWNFYNFTFFYAYLRVGNDRVVRRLIGLLLAVGVLVAAYGMYQFWVGPARFVEGSELLEARHTSEAYTFISDEDVHLKVFRPFSTLHSAGGLGATMAALSFLGLSAILRRDRGRLWRIPLGLATLALFGAMLLLTGSRTSAIVLGFGLLCMLAIERRLSLTVLFVLMVGLAMYPAAVISRGAILDRLETLNPTATGVGVGETNWQRVYLYRLQNNMGWVVALEKDPLGLGLGTTGVGVPTFPGRERWGFRSIAVDSDIGRAAVEMGIPGVLLVSFIVASMVFHSLRAANRLRTTPFSPLGSSLAAVVVGFLPSIFLGSPLYGPPPSLLIWSSLGALLKLEVLAGHAPKPAQPAVTAESARHGAARSSD